MSARKIDTNGFIEIKGNPISKVGVFQYSGAQLPASLNLDPIKLYNVYRSKEELSKPEAIESFKLLPWTDDHPNKLLGSSNDGLVPAEKKGVHGVTGEDIYVDEEFLRSNLKLFSQDLADQIESGKKDLSIGYKADYILSNGVYNGDSYEVIQTNLRGNHISSVDEGRSGRDVSVLDNKLTGVSEMNEEKDMVVKDEELTLSDLASQLKELKETMMESLGKLMSMEKEEAERKESDSSEENEKEYIESEIKEDEEAMDEDKEEKKSESKDNYKEGYDEDKEDDKKGAMDAALKKSVFQEISKRDKLSSRLAKHVGVFDSSEMTLKEVASYGVKKLGLTCGEGNESILIEGYLAGKGASAKVSAVAAMDHSIKSTSINKYLRGEK